MFSYKYPKPSLTADIALFDVKQRAVLLICRRNEPFKDCWALPGGFFDMDDDTIEATAKRELAEETGLTDIELTELGTASRKGRDPRGRTVTVVFIGKVDSELVETKGADDAKEARWFPIDSLPQLAFDHAEIIERAINSIGLRLSMTKTTD